MWPQAHRLRVAVEVYACLLERRLPALVAPFLLLLALVELVLAGLCACAQAPAVMLSLMAVLCLFAVAWAALEAATCVYQAAQVVAAYP